MNRQTSGEPDQSDVNYLRDVGRQVNQPVGPIQANPTSTPAEVESEMLQQARLEKSRRGWSLTAGLIGGLGGAALLLWVLSITGVLWDGAANAIPPQVPNDVVVRIITPTIDITNRTQTALDLMAVAAKTVPSVVTVHTVIATGNDTVVQGSGSGVILTIDGVPYIVTNAHVVDEGDDYTVILSDGRSYVGTLLGVDTLTDLAVMSVTAKSITSLTVGDTDMLEIGSPVAAVGNPLGLEGGPTVTGGSLSAVGRRVAIDGSGDLVGMLQTDASITQGSSGGALVNKAGELVGITTAVAVTEDGAAGLGFAVPVETVIRVAEDIVRKGSVTHPYLGLEIGTGALELGDGGVLPIGAEVLQVVPGGAGALGGLVVTDVIIALDDYSVQTSDMLLDRLFRYRAGETVTLTIRGNNGDERVVDIVLGGRESGG